MTTPIERAAEALVTHYPPHTYEPDAWKRDAARAAITAALGSVEETAEFLSSLGSIAWSCMSPQEQGLYRRDAEALHAHLLGEPETKEAGS